MEDNLTFLGKWKTTSIFCLMEDDLKNFLMEDNLKFFDIFAPPSQTLFIDLFPEHSLYEKVNISQKWSCRQKPSLTVRNLIFFTRL